MGKIQATLGISNCEHLTLGIGYIGMEDLKGQKSDGETTQTFNLSQKL